MLKTNSKIAREGVHGFVIATHRKDMMKHQHRMEALSRYADSSIQSLCMSMAIITGETFKSCLSTGREVCRLSVMQVVFCGSPSSIMVVGDILEETIAERERYTEEQASILLCKMVYMEIVRHC